MSASEAEILEVAPGAQGVRIELRVPRDLSWFEGHFPGCPLLPGVIQVTWAIEFARRYLALSPKFHSLSAMKFMRFILPGSEVTLLLEYAAEEGELSFEYRQGKAVCAAGKIGFKA